MSAPRVLPPRLRFTAPTQSRRLLGLFVSALVAVGILFTFVNPARTWLDQRHAISVAQEQSRVLDQESAALQTRADRLRTDAEVERLAREQYGLVKRGEEAYAVLPAPSAGPGPQAATPTRVHLPWWRRAWDAARFWD